MSGFLYYNSEPTNADNKMQIATNFKNVRNVFYNAEKQQIEGEVYGYKFSMDTSNLDIPFPQITEEYQDVVFGAIESQVFAFINEGRNEGELYAEIEDSDNENDEAIIIELRGWFE